MKPGSVAIVGAAETTKARCHPRDVADPASRRRGAQRAGRCGPQAAGHRRRGNGRQHAHRSRVLPRHHAELGRWHGCGRLLLHAACAPRRGGDQRGPVQDRAHHARRKRSLARGRAAAHDPAFEPAGPVRGALRHLRAAFAVHDPRAAFPPGSRHDAGAACDGRGRAARMGGQGIRARCTRTRSRWPTC